MVKKTKIGGTDGVFQGLAGLLHRISRGVYIGEVWSYRGGVYIGWQLICGGSSEVSHKRSNLGNNPNIYTILAPHSYKNITVPSNYGRSSVESSKILYFGLTDILPNLRQP